MKLHDVTSGLFLSEDEEIIHVAHLHFFYGFKWLFCALLCGLGAVLLAWYGVATHELNAFFLGLAVILGASCIGFGAIYRLPFGRSYIVITSQKAVLCIGQFTTIKEQILPHQLEDWEISQSFFASMLGYGHLTLRLLEGRQLRIIHIPYLNAPDKFTQSMDAMSPLKTRDGFLERNDRKHRDTKEPSSDQTNPP